MSYRSRRAAVLCALATLSGGCSVRIEHGTIRSDSATSAGGGYRTTRYGALSDTILHLVSGDSVELQSAGPLQVPKQPEGLMVTYHPYFDLADTARVRSIALQVFDALRPHFTNGEPPWLVLRAADRPAAARNAGGGPDHFYGIVLERRNDGRWYPLNDSMAVR